MSFTSVIHCLCLTGYFTLLLTTNLFLFALFYPSAASNFTCTLCMNLSFVFQISTHALEHPFNSSFLLIFSEAPDCVIDHTQGQTVEALPAEQHQEAEEVCSIQAHRVIVAARCDWFRRALLSGMREAIDRYPDAIHVYPSMYCSCVP
jgi:hypothetical protein